MHAGLPPILYGTAWKKADTARLVEEALRAGFRGIDTACQPKHYDEAGVGAGVAAFLESPEWRSGDCARTSGREPRSGPEGRAPGWRESSRDSSKPLSRTEIWLQTKFTTLSGQDPTRVPYDPKAKPAEQVAQSFHASLRNLRTDYLDALVLHSPTRDPTVWPAMEKLVDAGGVRRLGISNCYDLTTLERLHRTARVKPTIVQNRFYADSGYDRGIRAFCRANGLVYQSFWTLTANPHLLAAAALRAIATRHGRTPAQVLFRWLSQDGIVPLTGTRSEAHMQESLAIVEFELDPAEVAAIDALLS